MKNKHSRKKKHRREEEKKKKNFQKQTEQGGAFQRQDRKKDSYQAENGGGGYSGNNGGGVVKGKYIEMFAGKISITTKGVGIIKKSDLPEDLRIPTHMLNTALDGDVVTISLVSKKRGQRLEAKVEDVVERAKTKFVGTIYKSDGMLTFDPDDKRVYVDFTIIPNELSERSRHYQKAIIEMFEWTDPEKNPKAKIVKILGEKGEHNTEIISILYEKGFEPSFSDEVENEAKRIKEQAPADFEAEIVRRKTVSNPPPSSWDFRKTTTFTIDPSDAKDFDDALSFKDLGNGTYEVGVHIADVTHYVKKDGVIDREAIKRGTSVYLVDRTIPMLPEVLSNDLCSLNPNEDKLAFSAIFVVDDDCNIKERYFGETVIKSDKRFDYGEAQGVIDAGSGIFFEELNKLNELALKMRKRRMDNGALAFGSNEVQFELDKTGFPIRVYEKEMYETNELIEDFMLLANKEVSEYIDRLNQKTNQINPFVYRIHDKPKAERIIEMTAYLKVAGYEIHTKDGVISSKEVNSLIDKIKGSDEEALIEKAILRSMAKAIYSTNNIGHFGLAFKHYTHFTSPIRRYPDMMVHRLLKRYFSNERVALEEKQMLEFLANHSSQQEQAAVDAERDSDKYKYAEYMSKRIGEEFEGIITSVVEWGVYVQEVETKAEGLVSVKTLKGDYYKLESHNYRIVGERIGKTFTLGDRVKIKVLGADIERKTVDFEIIE